MREELVDELMAVRAKLKETLSATGIPASIQAATVVLVMDLIAADMLTKIEMNAREHHRNWPDCPSCVNAANRDMGAAHFFGIVAHDILGIPEERAVTEEEVIAALRNQLEEWKLAASVEAGERRRAHVEIGQLKKIIANYEALEK